MRIPKEILAASPAYVDDNLRQAFEQVGFGCLPIWTSTGCTLFVQVDERTIRECRNAVHSVRLELHEVDGCPLLRLDVKVYDRPGDPLHMDCFLNVQDTDHQEVVDALAEQEWMVFHWYVPGMKYARSSGIPWPPQQREEAGEIIKKARAIVDSGGGDFDQAKAKWMTENQLD